MQEVESHDSSQIVERLKRLLTEDDSLLRQQGLIQILEVIIDSHALPSLILALDDQDETIQRKAAEALGRIGDIRAVTPLIRKLEEYWGDARIEAAESLGKLNDVRAVESLIRALRDECWTVRRNAAVALGKIGDSRAVEPLMNALAGDMPRVEAVEALGKIGDQRAVERLIRILREENELKDPYVIMREKTSEALGNIGDQRAVESLLETLQDCAPGVRVKAVEALGNIRDLRAVDSLIRMLGDEHPTVQTQSYEVLVKFGVHALQTFLSTLEQPDPLIHRQMAAILHDIGWTPSNDEERTNYAVAKDNIPIIVFVSSQFSFLKENSFLLNPDCAQLKIPMLKLEKIVIDTTTYNFNLVECFITYAVNYIGQKYLKKHVEVHIYGDAEKLYPNLRNTFENICKCVEVH